ncbi:DNA-directed RNA polymerase [Litchfieldella qijiaojingensis]|uniref:DNA-directed RNA polymerase n=1 Tax=Litchfieldella qijiaojingensis TaxID=980347 RepID=A0ABQ2YQS9_9GAMM|nr:DNA-directed RNA polymerase [Halomonas qijiaojingensis]GGX90970.1 DNA-directed RNA polymerase [Halomonas qijiaojingensis]
MTTESITDQLIREIQNDPEFDAKFDRQVQLEEKMRGMGIDRYWSNIEKAREREQETSVRSVRRLMNQAIVDMTGGIETFLEEALSGKPGVKNTAAVMIKDIEPEVCAYIAARVVLDGIAAGRKFTPTAYRIGMMIEDELAFRAFKEQDKNAHDWLVKREEKNSTSYDRSRKVMRHNMQARDIEVPEWSPEQRTCVGTKLIEIMMNTTGLVTKSSVTRRGTNTEVLIEATPEAMDWINEENNRCELLSPVYLPTIIPPKPWTTPHDGGYWTTRVRKLKFIKTYNRAYLDELNEMDITPVYDAVNAMQSTAWAINPKMLDVVRTLWNNGSTLGGIPAADDYDLPPKPGFLDDENYTKDQWTDEEMDQFKAWKAAATDIHTANAQLKSLRLQLVKILTVAEQFSDEDRVYFPHQLDFRGRAYAVPMFLNPQGSDLAKGLLEFADGVPINDEEARAWLAVHGANVYGYDKDSLEGRVEWVEENEQEILASANDPFNNRMWADADDPFQFLAFCFEWQGLKEEGFGYVSTLPVQMDGSCNGLQNFSAALRDPVGGSAVNLTPQELPADIYQRVADIVEEQVKKDVHSDDEKTALNAAGWLSMGINRKTCKRPVMTLAYGAKEFGFKNQVFEDTVKPAKLELGTDFPWKDGGWGAAEYMGKLIWQSVAQVVVAAREAMDWFQKAARASSKEGLPVRWTTPDGLPVLQAYPKLSTKRIRMTFGGQSLRLSVAKDTGQAPELDRSKQANGISPNWVHSMDASHMRQTVRSCWKEGVRAFALVHDSYGTHAGNAWALADILREAFIEMYTERDVLADFKSELEDQLPEDSKLAPLPSKGSLDLEQVMESDFFFA